MTQKFHGNRIFISRMLNRNPKRLSAEVFSSSQKQPKQNANSQNREENDSTTLRNTREKPLLAGYAGLDNALKVFRSFYLYGGHIELLRLNEYYGISRGHEHDLLYSLNIKNMVFHCISREKGDISFLHPNTAQLSFFSLQSYSKKKNCKKKYPERR